MSRHSNKHSNAKRMTIAAVFLLLSLFTLLKTGQVVESFHDLIYKLFGTITNLLLILTIFESGRTLIDREHRFTRSKTFWGLVMIVFAILMVTTMGYMIKVGLNNDFIYYVERLNYASQMNGGIVGYIFVRPLYALFGGAGVNLVAIIVGLIGVYFVLENFFEFDDKIIEEVKKGLTPKKVTSEELREKVREHKTRKEEKLAQRELANAKPVDTEIKVVKEDESNHFLNVAIKREQEQEIEVFENTNIYKAGDFQTNDDEQESAIDIMPISHEPITRPNEDEQQKAERELALKQFEAELNQIEKPQANLDKQEPIRSQTANDVFEVKTKSSANVNVMKVEATESKQATAVDSDYVIPPIEMLSDGMKDLAALKRLEQIASENASILEMTLDSFNLKAKISNVSIGPNITKYELQPEIGTKVSRFSSLSNDLAMALAATSIRIEAPIPGKAAVGIEIPNKEMLSVSLKEVLMSANNDMSKKLQVALGKDITGESIFMEINKTPHMLVAGATGSGKSVSINSFILSILLKASPEEVKMIMIDPKKVELAPYNGIPHLLTPVVTEPKRAAVILKKMVAEMETRYELFSRTNTRNIEGFNDKIEKDNPNNFKTLPYVVIIIDELADLMMVASNEVETSIARLAQMARAAGIHLVIATQRPSTDVITGLIKSNIPTRLSFSVSSSIDSRTILDQSGAEKLLGKGDMLYAANGKNNLERIQGTYVSDDEIMEIVEFIKNQQYGLANIQAEQEKFEAEIEVSELSGERDDLFDEAVEVILAANSASTSLLQRRLKVGFNRASQIMEQMEEAGIVSANEGTKPRKILISAYGENEDEQY